MNRSAHNELQTFTMCWSGSISLGLLSSANVVTNHGDRAILSGALASPRCSLFSQRRPSQGKLHPHSATPDF